MDQIVPLKHGDSDEAELKDRYWEAFDEFAIENCKQFLRPYLDMQYPRSVRAIKSSIATVENCSPQLSIEREIQSFSTRWCSLDNLNEISRRTR